MVGLTFRIKAARMIRRDTLVLMSILILLALKIGLVDVSLEHISTAVLFLRGHIRPFDQRSI